MCQTTIGTQYQRFLSVSSTSIFSSRFYLSLPATVTTSTLKKNYKLQSNYVQHRSSRHRFQSKLQHTSRPASDLVSDELYNCPLCHRYPDLSSFDHLPTTNKANPITAAVATRIFFSNVYVSNGYCELNTNQISRTRSSVAKGADTCQMSK